ncbi:hypothetical protein GCM10018954_049640 [Kutzneria kofuensis]
MVVKLNPASIWGPRTQTIEVLGREQSGSGFTSLVPAKSYSFDPASGNTVTIPVSARVADVQLKFTANSGAGGGQAAEFQVIGVPAPNPDLTITGSSWTPSSPVETDSITASATVKNSGPLSAGATDVNFYLGTTKVGTASVGALAAGASSTVSASIGTRDAGSYQLTAKVDEANKVIEQNEANNSYTNPTALVVTPVQSSDLVATTNWTPGNPSAGNPVQFSVTLKNQGTIASAGGAHGITVKVADAASGSTVATLTGSYSGVINAGATASPVTVGSWTAANGNYTITTTVANDANELPVKQANNTSTSNLFVGRGANMPYDSYEAESGVLGGGAAVLSPNRTIGDLAGEASGRQAVTLNQTGASVEFTTREATNTLVTRFSIPDGTTSTLDIYVDGTLLKPISLTSQYAWLYGAEASPGNDPGAGGPRHIYDEANVLLGTTVPAGHKIRLQKDAANSGTFAIDFINLELATPQANPDPAHYAVPAGFTQQDVQNAFDKVRQDSTLTGVYLPAGDYSISSKMTIYGKAVTVGGAGPWYTRFNSPSGQTNTDVGIDIQSSANGSKVSGVAFFGNWTSRQDGPGKVFNLTNVSNVTLDNIWIEHQMCLFWGQNVQNITISNSRIRDTFADGVNMTNGSSNNHIVNDEARSTGDDSFAMFAATDAGGGNETGNVFENLTAVLTWRAAGFAVYGGEDNTFRNLYVADMLTYAGITVSSLNFGYPMRDFGPDPTTIQNVSIVRAGGHFWGQQTFPGIWLFSANQKFQGIRISDVDIVSPHLQRHHVPDRLRRRGAAQPDHRHRADQRVHQRRAAERRRPQRQVRLRDLGQRAARTRPGPGGRFGDVHQPEAVQQLHRHQEHDQHVHHQPELARRRGRPPAVSPPGAGPCPAGRSAARRRSEPVTRAADPALSPPPGRRRSPASGRPVRPGGTWCRRTRPRRARAAGAACARSAAPARRSEATRPGPRRWPRAARRSGT